MSDDPLCDPLSFSRRTPLRRAMEAHGAVRWRALADSAVAEPRQEVPQQDAPLGIADLTPLPRLGFKGRGTLAAMRQRGLWVEDTANRAFRQADGGLCLVLGPGEVLLLGSLDGEGARLAALEADWRIEEGERTYPLPRRDSHAWLGLLGPAVPAMFAKLCAIDLRLGKFADLSIAQTSVAKLNAIVVRADRANNPLFYLLFDSAAGAYMLDCLLDAATEFGGRMIGLGVLADLET